MSSGQAIASGPSSPTTMPAVMADRVVGPQRRTGPATGAGPPHTRWRARAARPRGRRRLAAASAVRNEASVQPTAGRASSLTRATTTQAEIVSRTQTAAATGSWSTHSIGNPTNGTSSRPAPRIVSGWMAVESAAADPSPRVTYDPSSSCRTTRWVTRTPGQAGSSKVMTVPVPSSLVSASVSTRTTSPGWIAGCIEPASIITGCQRKPTMGPSTHSARHTSTHR